MSMAFYSYLICLLDSGIATEFSNSLPLLAKKKNGKRKSFVVKQMAESIEETEKKVCICFRFDN